MHECLLTLEDHKISTKCESVFIEYIFIDVKELPISGRIIAPYFEFT